MVQYTIYKTVLLYLLKFIRLYEHQQETKVSFVAIFGTLAKNRQKIIYKDDKTSIIFTVTCNISTLHTWNNFVNLGCVQNQFYWL